MTMNRFTKLQQYKKLAWLEHVWKVKVSGNMISYQVVTLSEELQVAWCFFAYFFPKVSMVCLCWIRGIIAPSLKCHMTELLLLKLFDG